MSKQEEQIRERSHRWLRSSTGRYWLAGVSRDTRPGAATDRAVLLQLLDTVRADVVAQLLQRRGVEGHLCARCEGLGVIEYDNTATWGRTAVGTPGRVLDICNQCWGSGHDQKHWTDLRQVLGCQRDLSVSQQFRVSERIELQYARTAVVKLWDALQEGDQPDDSRLVEYIQKCRRKLKDDKP